MLSKVCRISHFRLILRLKTKILLHPFSSMPDQSRFNWHNIQNMFVNQMEQKKDFNDIQLQQIMSMYYPFRQIVTVLREVMKRNHYNVYAITFIVYSANIFRGQIELSEKIVKEIDKFLESLLIGSSKIPKKMQSMFWRQLCDFASNNLSIQSQYLTLVDQRMKLKSQHCTLQQMQEISRYYPSDCSSVKMTQLKNMLYKVTLFEFNRFVTLPSITVDDERRLMKLSAVTVDILDKAKLKEYFAVYSTLPTKFSSQLQFSRAIMALTLLHNFEYIRRLYYVQMNYYHTQLIKNNARLVSNQAIVLVHKYCLKLNNMKIYNLKAFEQILQTKKFTKAS